ncbi:MAG: GNAT family N-acetyltransferase [Saonia sp.]
MNIRDATHRDTNNIIQLVKTVLKEFGFQYSPDTSESDLMNIHQEYLDNEGAFLIMEDNAHTLIATGALKKIGDGCFKIRKMYVHKLHRRNGYGKEILIRLIEIALKKGATTIVLETSALMISAQNLYASFGFEVIAKKPTSPRCDITMVKKINDA